MSGEDVARVIVYSAVALPAILFVLAYGLILPRIKITTETIHLIAFTGVIAYIAIDFLVAIVLNWWDFSLARFLTVLSFAAILLWQRVYLLVRHNVVPILRHRHEARQAVD